MSRKVLIFIVAYNHEKTIQNVLSRIPTDLGASKTEILVIDDSSSDKTFDRSLEYQPEDRHPKLTVLYNPVNQGYGGILDLTHKRLFTFGSLARLFEERGFEITDISGVPAPFPLALGQTRLAHSLLVLNRALISLSRGLFSYQIMITARPRPSLALLLSEAERSGQEKTANLEK